MLKGTTCTYYIMYVHVCMYVLTTRNNHNYLHAIQLYNYYGEEVMEKNTKKAAEAPEVV